MFYSEKLKSPIDSWNVKRLYGVNPDNEPARAALIGIYPLTEAPEGYSVSRYEKVGNTYRAIPNHLSDAELSSVRSISTLVSRIQEVEEGEFLDGDRDAALLSLIAGIDERLNQIEQQLQ